MEERRELRILMLEDVEEDAELGIEDAFDRTSILLSQMLSWT